MRTILGGTCILTNTRQILSSWTPASAGCRPPWRQPMPALLSSSSPWAQVGIAAAVGTDDRQELQATATLAVGARLNSTQAVHGLVDFITVEQLRAWKAQHLVGALHQHNRGHPGRAGSACVAFIHQRHLHAKALSLVGEHVAHDAPGHPVQALVGLCTTVGALSDSADVANGDGLHAGGRERPRRRRWYDASLSHRQHAALRAVARLTGEARVWR
jgi:hypothetical protein